ncbi:hypothetical protein BD779DRAFT_552958 [Infundibulicybe gibba]|nr:hypothetical protein BD779DRAFT_552958 [Infundibulicybe gibba]
MLTAQGFSAWVSVDGVELPQYAVESRDAAGVKETVTCYIPSEANKEFAVYWTSPPYPFKLVGDVRVDGIWISGKGNKVDMGSTQQASFVRTSDRSARPLMFSLLERTDDDACLASSTKDLGEIKLDVWTARCPEYGAPRDCYSTTLQTPTKIHERSKSVMSHRASFGREVPTRPIRRKPARRDRRVVTFIFKYRSQDYLKAEGIIPSDSKPPNAAATKQVAEVQVLDITDDSDSELELRYKEEELKARLKRIKAKRSKKRKLRHRPSAAPRARGEIIDLGIIDLT